jgi:glutathione synthase/RimK-type ligase-like ATP-grasp enzyme
MRPIGIFYEHPDWFKPLFTTLERRGIPYERIPADQHGFPLHGSIGDFSLVFNRASPSAYTRGRANTTFYTLDWVRALEAKGIPVVNGSEVYSYEISKARQLLVLEELGLPYPKAWTINHPSQALRAVKDLRYPIVVKANIGGSGAGIVRYDNEEQLTHAIAENTVQLGVDGTALVQELCPLRDGHITRVETLNGEYLYAIKVFPEQGSFDLCPADACQTKGGQELSRSACALDAPKRGLKVEAYTPPAEIIDAVQRIARRVQLDVGGVEYLIDDRDGRAYFYDINALSNFVADAPNVIGFDPFEKLVDYLVWRAQAGRS